MDQRRREFLKLLGMGAVVVVGGGLGAGNAMASRQEGFYFLQLSDTHWGFAVPEINPDAAISLKNAVTLVNNLKRKPDFIVFTGDLTQTTDDDQERRKRLGEFKKIIEPLAVKDIKFLPGEHDAGLDEGAVYKEFFGKTYYTFNHKGVHFIVLDNVSDPHSKIGDTQLAWLADTLKNMDKDARIVVLTHRPLFDLYPQWDWFTADGDKAIELLMPFKNVTVFYGHIHQEHHHTTGHIEHHAAHGLMYPLPAPGSVPKKAPIPWDAAAPYKGLGFRGIEAKAASAKYALTEFPLKKV